MNWFKASCYTFCLPLFFLIIGGVSQPILAMSKVDNVLTPIALGQEVPPDSTFQESLKLETKYPSVQGNAGSIFEFEVKINYRGEVGREFQLSTNTPEGFLVTITPAYETKEISSIFLGANLAYPETIKVKTTPAHLLYTEKLPPPGEYVITLTASSTDGKLAADIDLKVIITAKYDMSVETGGGLEGRLNTKAAAGEDNHITLVITNTGTVPLEKLTFSSEKSAGWSVTFEPNEIDSIASGASREVDVNIKPPRKTVSGDYEVALKVDTKDNVAYKRLDIRVTVETSAIWSWVGIGIVIVVVAGLAVVFTRLSRR